MADIFQIAPWMLPQSRERSARDVHDERMQFNEDALAAHFYSTLRENAMRNGASAAQANNFAISRAPSMANMFARHTLETIKEGQSQRLENIKLQNEVKTREGLANFTDAASKVTDWTSEAQESQLRNIAAQNPFIINTPAYQNVMKLFPEARQEKRLQATAELRAATQAQIAVLRSLDVDRRNDARLNEIEARAALGLDVRTQIAELQQEHRMAQIERRGEQSLEQIEARHQARLQEIDAKIKGTLENAPKMIRNTARVAALQSELRALEDDIKLKYDPVKKAAALEAILKKYEVDIKSETIKTVPGTGLTPIGPPIPELDDIELRYARDAIAAGVPKDRVSARYKQRTGKDFPE